MRRLTARLLLLFAIAGTFVPIALAYAAPVPSCCLRKAVHQTMHHCHEAADTEMASSGEEQSTLHASATCNHECCRGAATSQSARPQSPLIANSLAVTHSRIIHAQPESPSAALATFQSTRAPPAVLL
jgi:hypothetical protein